MSSGYALKCLTGPQAGTWYTRRGVVLRFTKVKAAILAGRLNDLGSDVWFATKHRTRTASAAQGTTVRAQRARVHTSKGYLIVMVVGRYRSQWRVKAADYPIRRPSGVSLGSGTMLVPQYALRFLPKRGRARAAERANA